MKKRLLFLAVCLFAAAGSYSITFFVGAAATNTIEPTDVPFVFDVTAVPEGARLIGWMEMNALTLYPITPEIIDPDGDPCIVTALSLPEGMHENASVPGQWVWIPEKVQAGVHFIAFKGVDVPPDGEEAYEDIACYVVKVKRGNAGPRFERFDFGIWDD